MKQSPSSGGMKQSPSFGGMTTITVEATYTNGLLQPATRLNLPEGARVEVHISELPLAVAGEPSLFGSLRGILGNLTDAEVADVESDLAAIRQQTRDRIERLARDL